MRPGLRVLIAGAATSVDTSSRAATSFERRSWEGKLLAPPGLGQLQPDRISSQVVPRHKKMHILRNLSEEGLSWLKMIANSCSTRSLLTTDIVVDRDNAGYCTRCAWICTKLPVIAFVVFESLSNEKRMRSSENNTDWQKTVQSDWTQKIWATD